MRFDVVTIFPEAFASYLNASMLKRAKEKRLIDVRIHNLRDFAAGKHKSVDAPPYGGGPGMVFKIEPLAKAFLGLKSKPKNTHVVFFHASGKQFNQKMAGDWSKNYKQIIMIAGHYEGVDERIKPILRNLGFAVEKISIGPYVLTGGELPAMIVIDAVSRHIPGVLGRAESLEERRLGVGVPVYTRPEAFTVRGKKYSVPKVLLSGNHKKIEEWRRRHGPKPRH
ncbi:MAG: tRNA (guanosine(37)-N1)-methyltransferase TrmD [Candidatus Sungiibacteriota bacterium]